MRRIVHTYRIARVPAALAALILAAPAALAAQARQLEVTLPVAAAEARTRVQRVFVDDQLQITSATGDVIEARDSDKIVVLRYLAMVLPVDSVTSRVVLTAFALQPAIGVMSGGEGQITAKTGGVGKKAWARLTRLHDALGAQPVQKDAP